MKAVKICVLPASILKSLKVFDPVIVTVQVLQVAFQKLLYDNPLPKNAFVETELLVSFIVEELGVSVKFETVLPEFHTFAVPVSSQVPDHIKSALVAVELALNVRIVTFLLLASREPPLRVNVFVHKKSSDNE